MWDTEVVELTFDIERVFERVTTADVAVLGTLPAEYADCAVCSESNPPETEYSASSGIAAPYAVTECPTVPTLSPTTVSPGAIAWLRIAAQ